MVKLVVTFGFLLAFAAGLVVGMEKSSSTPAAPGPATHPSGPRGMAAELNLSTEQQDQMKKIWSDVAQRGRGQPQQGEHRMQLRQERDEAIANLVHPEDKDKYDQIQKSFRDQVDAMDREMRDAFEKAVKATDEILTPEQRTKYHEMLAKHQPGGPHDRRGGDHGDRSGDHGVDHGTRSSNSRGNEGATTLPRSG
jgi:Spy/CpxP family protein refolding chaperone